MKQRPSARVRANRQNALRSTGPKTALGKARSSRNALLHGLCAPAPFSDQELEPLAEVIADGDASPEIMRLARCVAEADATARQVRRLRAVAFECLVKDNSTDKSLMKGAPSVDPVTAAISDPNGRSDIRGVTLAGAKLLRIQAWAIRVTDRLQKKEAAAVARRVHRLDLYEKRALALRRRALRELNAARRAKQA